MRKFKLFLVLVIMLFNTVVNAQDITLRYDDKDYVYTGSVFSLIVNNRELDSLPMPPVIFNDRALVPIREIFEELGARVSYDGGERRIEVVYGDTYIRMYINDNTAYVNGKKKIIPDKVVPKLISMNGGETKTMVPVRFISETIGIPVDFSSENEAILVNSPGYVFGGENITPAETPIPDEPAASKGIIKNIFYNMSDNTLEIRAEADAVLGEVSSFTMTTPNRVVTDIYGFTMDKRADITIDSDLITGIRFGENDERLRIVVDLESEISEYQAKKISDTELVITVTASEMSSTQPPKETPKPSATATPKPSATATPKPPTYSPYPSSSKLIVIDSGHGGKDSGAVGTLDGKTILEKDLTLSIAKKVRDILQSEGYTVEMTRSTDKYLELTEPPLQANEQNAALFVSVHINSAENVPEAAGTEVYYSLENNDDDYGITSAVFAKNVLNKMLYNMESKNRGVKTANHAVTRRCNMPAVLVEVGFISNEDELRKMCTQEYQQKTAKGIAEGIKETLKKVTIPEKTEEK